MNAVLCAFARCEPPPTTSDPIPTSTASSGAAAAPAASATAASASAAAPAAAPAASATAAEIPPPLLQPPLPRLLLVTWQACQLHRMAWGDVDRMMGAAGAAADAEAEAGADGAKAAQAVEQAPAAGRFLAGGSTGRGTHTSSAAR